MNDQLKPRYSLLVCFLVCLDLLTACSYLTDFVVVNETDNPIEVRYVIKNPVYPHPPELTIPVKPATKKVSQLHQQIAWQELSPTQYTFNPDTRMVITSLMPGEALKIEQCNLVDGKVDDRHLNEKFRIERIFIVGSHGELDRQGEQLRTMFTAESNKIHVLTYK